MFEVHGRIVPLAPESPDRDFLGRVRFTDGRVEHIKARRLPPTDGTPHVDLGEAYVYPGLIDLHSHIGYNALPLWREEKRMVPWLHRDQWPGASTYKQNVSWPAYAYLKGAPEELMAYVQVRALAGGTTAIQGWPPANGSPTNKLVRNIDDDEGRDAIRTSVVNLDVSQLRERARSMFGGTGFIYHLAEGQLDSLVAREFGDAARAGCLQSRLIAIHCTAVDDAEFKEWAQMAALDNNAPPGGVVWSPLSNLWLYGETTRVEAAIRHGVRVCLGSDWGPSGSKNLLGELKVARVWADQAGLGISDHQLVAMVTANPGDLLAQVWGETLGRLVPGAFGDAVVVARRRSDPWSNLIAAREEDVLLVIVGGQPVYGTRELMRALAVGVTTSVPIGRHRRHVPLRRPSEPSRLWAWRSVLAELNRVAKEPLKAIESANQALDRALASGLRTDHALRESGLLILEPDMPGGAHAIAGPPPPGAVFEMAKPPSLVHDRAWHRSFPEDGFDAGVLARTTAYYED